jgi:hypothetical protein
MYLATEKKYAFTAENLAATIPEFIENEKKQQALAQKWIKLMDPETGMVSVADIFTACRAGGLNTYKVAGYEKCREFIVKLIENAEGELDEDFLNGFCPGLNEKGKNPNALSTITDKTRIGDYCSSKTIYAGEVTFRKGYNCTCTAYACNPGYEFKGGRCVTIVADGEGNCLRKEFPKTDKVNTTAKAIKFCQEYATKNKCKYNSVNMMHSISKVICNPTQDEIDAVRAGMLANKDKQIAELKYYEVCGQHKGKTGKKEYCVENIFGDVDTGLNEAAGLSQLYAKEKQGKTIYCDTKYREKSNDDYVKCATLEKDVFYEFRFDDVSESSDDAKFADTIMGLAAIYGYKSSSNVISGPCTTKIQNAAKKMGMTTSSWSNNKCALWRGVQITSNKNLTSKLRSIEGLDCTIGKSIQTQGSTEVRNKLLSYIRAQGFLVTDFECDNGYGTVYNGMLRGNDDTLTCRVTGTFNGKRYNKQPVDFVFDDMSEGKKYQQKAGNQGLNCIAYNGNFDGHYCRKLTKAECFQLEREMLAELKRQGKYTGDDDLVDWDEAAGACELNDAQVANNINKVGKYTAIVGLTVAGAFTGGSTSAVAVSLMAVELAGVAGELYAERKIEVLPQEWANNFLAESRKCNNSSCAETTLRSNFQKIAQASDKLNRDVLNEVDTEMARLAEKIPNERLQQIIDSSEPPSCWDTWECQRWIFVGMQCASLAVGVGKGLVKMTKVFAGKAGAVTAKTTAKAATSTLSHGDDLTRGATKSLKEELSSIGVEESKAYRDIKTGKMLSKDEVLRRIDNMPGGTGANKTLKEELAEIGVREESVYRDIASNKFISREEVLRRIDNMPSSKSPSSTPKSANGAETGATGSAKPDEKLLNMFNDAPGNGAGRVVNQTGDVAGLRAKIGGDFDKYIAQAKNSTDFRSGVRIPKDKLTKEEWDLLNKSLEKDGVEFLSDGGYYELSRINYTAGDVQRVINKALNNQGGEYYITEKGLTSSQLDEIQRAIKHKNIQFVKQGDGYLKLVRSYNLDIVKGAKNFSGNIGRYRVSLEKLPVQGGGTSEVVNISGRAVAVVNVNGRKIPFYVSSGQAGKDAIGIPSGKWYPIAGIGKDGRGWFNKMPDMMKNPVRELDDIANRLERTLNPQELKQMALDSESGMSNVLSTPSSTAYRIINSEFKNGIVPELEHIGQQGVGQIPEQYVGLYNQNIELIKNMFK